MSNRINDHKAEQEVGKFLDKYFYPKHTQNFIRINEIEKQLKGVDVNCDYQNLHFISIDEKAATSWVNKNLKTFAFEVDSYQKGVIRPGWLFDKEKVTDYYLLCWIWAEKDKNFTCNDITKVECMLISRDGIIKYLSTYETNEKTSKEIALKMRNNEDKKLNSKKFENCPFYFVQSLQLEEKPVNIIIPKAKLKELATQQFFVVP